MTRSAPSDRTRSLILESADLARHAGQWLRVPGPDSDVVLSTRIRLARNVEGYEFPGRIASATRRELET